MKLNKPPVTEEQNALEEYVDFLLTDLSNVTSIHGKISNNRNKPEVNAETRLQEKSESFENGLPSVLVAIEKFSENIHLKTEQEKSNADHKINYAENKSSEPIVDGDVASFIYDQIEETTIDTAICKKSSHGFVAESEEEELKKWDAVLTEEKENEILAKEQEEKGFLLALEREQRELIKTEQLNKVQEKKTQVNTSKSVVSNVKPQVRHERPAVYDEPLPQKEPDKRLEKVEKLLARISLATQEKTVSTSELSAENDVEAENEISQEAANATFLERKTIKTKDLLPDVFQTLIFKVAKLPLAVPLLKLGGIVAMNEKLDITPLVGTPDWFLGMMPHSKGNLMVVDTQKYLMPEQVKDKVVNTTQEYQYLILLDNSNWALACHDVGDAKNLTQDDIRWSEKTSKRPWFGGMVVEYMSALIEVDELINMLASNIAD
jgi:hypothetical protein